MGIGRAFAWNVFALLCSIATTVVVVFLLPLSDPEQSPLAEAALLLVFFGCYTTLFVLY